MMTICEGNPPTTARASQLKNTKKRQKEEEKEKEEGKVMMTICEGNPPATTRASQLKNTKKREEEEEEVMTRGRQNEAQQRTNRAAPATGGLSALQHRKASPGSTGTGTPMNRSTRHRTQPEG
jgi:hypothetical protein